MTISRLKRFENVAIEFGEVPFVVFLKAIYFRSRIQLTFYKRRQTINERFNCYFDVIYYRLIYTILLIVSTYF